MSGSRASKAAPFFERLCPARRTRRLQHRRQDPVGRSVAVHEGLDIDNDLVAHVDAPFDRGRSEMRQQNDFARARELDELGTDGGLVFENIETGAGDFAGFDQARKRIFVDDLAAGGVDDVSLGPDELQPACSPKIPPT